MCKKNNSRSKFLSDVKYEKNSINVLLELIGHNKFKKFLVKKTSIFEHKSVIKYLDIGCADGEKTIMFREYLKKVLDKNIELYGLDIHPKNVELSRNRGIMAFLCDVETENLLVKSDIITTFEVIEHIYNTDVFLENIYNSLNKNGIAIISTPNTVSLKNRFAIILGVPPLNLEVSLKKHYGLKFLRRFYEKKNFYPVGHIRGFTPTSLKEMLYDTGFKDVTILGVENWKLLKPIQMFPELSTIIVAIATK